jgi:hypothetical protein
VKLLKGKRLKPVEVVGGHQDVFLGGGMGSFLGIEGSFPLDSEGWVQVSLGWKTSAFGCSTSQHQFETWEKGGKTLDFR